jgi:hypothetical protein
MAYTNGLQRLTEWFKRFTATVWIYTAVVWIKIIDKKGLRYEINKNLAW